MNESQQQELTPTLQQIADELARVCDRVEGLEDARDLDAAIRRNGDKPLIPWDLTQVSLNAETKPGTEAARRSRSWLIGMPIAEAAIGRPWVMLQPPIPRSACGPATPAKSLSRMTSISLASVRSHSHRDRA